MRNVVLSIANGIRHLICFSKFRSKQSKKCSPNTMKTKIKTLTIGFLATMAFVVMSTTTQAQVPIEQWGLDLNINGPWSLTGIPNDGTANTFFITESNGNFNNNAGWKAPLPGYVLANIGDKVIVKGTMIFTNGVEGGGLFGIAGENDAENIGIF